MLNVRGKFKSTSAMHNTSYSANDRGNSSRLFLHIISPSHGAHATELRRQRRCCRGVGQSTRHGATTSLKFSIRLTFEKKLLFVKVVRPKVQHSHSKECRVPTHCVLETQTKSIPKKVKFFTFSRRVQQQKRENNASSTIHCYFFVCRIVCMAWSIVFGADENGRSDFGVSSMLLWARNSWTVSVIKRIKWIFCVQSRKTYKVGICGQCNDPWRTLHRADAKSSHSQFRHE